MSDAYEGALVAQETLPWALATSLPPPGNAMVLNCATVDLLSPEACRAAVDACTDTGWSDGAIAPTELGGDMRITEYRRVRIHPVADAHHAIIRSVVAAVHSLNDRLWRFDITGIVGNDGPSVMRYEAGWGHYHEHPDIGPHAPTRKLSFTVQLSDPSDFDGGELVVGGETLSPKVGALHVFPSYLPHEVHKVVRGRRLVLVGWMHGATFR